MNFVDPHFAEPQWLWLAVLGPLALFTLHRYSGWARKRQLRRIAHPLMLKSLIGSHSPQRRFLKESFLLLALAGIGIALARPQWGQQTEAGRALGKDTVFLLDCSRSMLATDIRPSRLERAKLAILDYVQRMGRGRVGVVAFAGQAFLQCPLTYDYAAFREALLFIDEKTIPVPGTDIGRALDEAFRATEKSERQKLLVLVTDGEDLEKSGIVMAEKLAGKGVIIYTVGVGTPAGSEIHLLNERGQLELVRDEKNEVVLSRLDEPTLQAIAKATHGAYYPLGPLGEGLTRARLASEKLSSGLGTAPTRKLGIDRFHLPLALVILLLVAESLIGTRRRLASRSKAIAGLLLAAALGLLSSTTARAATEDRPSAQDAREIYNAGTRQLEAGKLREAEQLLETALATQTDKLQPNTLYNLGHVRFRQGLEEIKKGPPAKTSLQRGKAAAANSHRAVQAATDALEAKDLQRMVNAYLMGRGARKELNAALKAVRQASQLHGKALNRWQRASGDFKSASELNPKDAAARENAAVVDKSIAELIDSLQELQEMAGMLGDIKEELGGKMKQLKGQIPEENMPPGAPGDEEEEEKELKPKDLEGTEEGPSKEGKEMELSPEQAGWLLEAFRLDKERHLPMGEGTQNEPRDRKRPTW